MMGITDFGRIIHAQAMAGQTFHLAWGQFPAGYAAPWSTGQTPPTALSKLSTLTLTRGTGTALDSLGQTGVISIVSVVQGGTTYVQGTGGSYQLTGNSVDFSIAGANPVPAAGSAYTVIFRYAFTAITSLLSEVGRRAALTVGYANPDPAGTIIANGSTWTYTTTPTANLYLQFKYDPTDGVGSIIAQVGLFLGSVYANGVAAGTQYVTPGQLANQGSLYMIDNVEPYSRFAGKREVYEFVVSY